ncbi:MAG: LysM peptidoglycan-binding domain-containing protein, partial [Prevotellaceae bacterium]|nr:LysM peptidoglycan-binding domain-containing protein [Prevotellaceae bacterium]
MKHFVLILALLLYAGATAHAQSPVITRSTEIVADDNGRRFYVHTVRQGETLYSLCLAYGVEQPLLMRLNPALYSGLKAGQKLTIPVAGNSEAKPAPASNPAEALSVEHVVKRRETLFSISNLYDVSIASIRQRNPQVFADGSDKLKRGQTLYIPIGLSGAKPDADKAAAQLAGDGHKPPFDECDGATYTLPINVALLLPFDAGNFDERDSYSSFRFVEVYEGALIALESLRLQGVSVNLTVIDSRSATPETTMLNPALSNADIIVGPVYQESFKPIAEFAKSRNIRIVSLLTPIDTALNAYANVFQVPTGFDEQLNQSMAHSHLDPAQSNVVLVWERDNEASKALRNKYRSHLPPYDSTFYRNLTMSRDSNTMERLHSDYLFREHKPTVKNLAYKVGFQPRENQGTLLKIF